MRIHQVKRGFRLFLVLALFLGLQLFNIGLVPAAADLPAPQIISVVSSSGTSGETVTITGANFGSSQGSSTVTFGETSLPGSSIISWSDTQILCNVPEGMAIGQVTVVVTTPGGVSNGVLFKVDSSSAVLGAAIGSITPNQAMQFSLLQFKISIGYSGWFSTLLVSLQNEETTIIVGGGTYTSMYEISGVAWIYGPPGVYDVVVTGPFGEARLVDGFTITPVCGAGSGSALLMLGITMGLLSLAGSGGLSRRRRRKSQ